MALKKDLPRQNTEELRNPQVEMFIKNIVADDRAVYLHIPAVSAGEAYGPNNWGDYFPEESLKKTYKTFYNAKVYRRHKNKDPRKSVGDVVLSTYNPKMRRVELVVKIYKDLAPDIVDDARSGKPVGFSMGCRVPYEECSVCDTKVFKTADRCDHMKHHMNQMVDGKLCYAINRYPEFFDISETPNPADKTVWSIKKVASEAVVEDTHIKDLTEEELVEGFAACSDLYFTPRESLFKTASKDTLNKFASEGLYPAIATSLINGFVFTPEEFQYISLSGESEKLAERFYDDGATFEGLDGFLDYSIDSIDKVASSIIDVLEKTATTEAVQDAVTESLLSRNPLRSDTAALSLLLAKTRLDDVNVKTPKDLEKFPDILNLLLRTGLLYAGYRVAASKIPVGKIKSLLNSQPAKVLGAIGGYDLAKKTMRGEKVASYFDMDKHAGWLKHGLIGLGGSYVVSSEAFRRAHRGQKVPSPLRFVAENPLISTVGLGLLSHKSGKLLSKLGKSGIVKKSSENEVKLDSVETCVEYGNLRDVFSASTNLVDQELYSLAGEQLMSVNELFR